MRDGTRDTLQIKTCPQKNRSAMDMLKMLRALNLPCRSLDLDRSRLKTKAVVKRRRVAAA